MVEIRNWIRTRLEIIASTRDTTSSMRIGQLYSEGQVEAVSRREDVAYFWTTGIVERSFRDGFTIKDKKGDEPDWIDKFQNQNYLDEIIRGVVSERKFGQVTFALFQDDDSDEIDLLHFPKKNVKLSIDDDGKIDAYELSREISQTKLAIPYEIAADGLDNVFHEVLRPGKYMYQGISVLEPIWDLIDARQILFQCSSVLTARVASGIRSATVMMRTDGTKDTAAVEAAELGLARLEATDTSIVLRHGVKDGVPWRDELNIIGGPDYKFIEKLDMIHRGLSVATNISSNFFNGIYVGSLTGAETVLQILFAALKKIQDDWSYRLEAIIKQWCEISGKKWDPDLHIEWALKPILTEQDKANVEYIKAQTMALLYSAGLIEQSEGRDKLGFDPTVVVEKPVQLGVQIEGMDNKTQQDSEEPEDV